MNKDIFEIEMSNDTQFEQSMHKFANTRLNQELNEVNREFYIQSTSVWKSENNSALAVLESEKETILGVIIILGIYLD